MLTRINEKIIVGFALTLYITLSLSFITSTPIGMDEPFSIFTAQKSISKIVTSLLGGNNPPLYEILLHLWIKLFGISPMAVRSLSVCFGALTLLILYKISQKLFWGYWRLAPMYLFIFSTYFFFITSEARAYSLFLMLFLTLLNFMLVENKERYDKILILVSATLMCYTHYLGFYVIGVICLVYGIWNFSTLLKRSDYVVYSLLYLVLVSPYLVQLSLQLGLTLDVGMWLSPVKDLGNFLDAFRVFCNSNTLYFGVAIGTILFSALTTPPIFQHKYLSYRYLSASFLLIIFLSAYVKMPFLWRITSIQNFEIFLLSLMSFGLCIVLLRISLKFDFYFLICLFYFSVVGAFFISFHLPIYAPKYLIYVAPLFLIILVYAIYFLRLKRLKYVLLITLCAIAFKSFNPKYTQGDEMNQVAGLLKAKHKNQHTILIYPSYIKLNFIYHYNREWFVDYSRFETLLNENGIFPLEVSSEMPLEYTTNEVYLITNKARNEILKTKWITSLNASDIIEIREFSNNLRLIKYRF